jgi:multidrug resistance efflux pump
MSDRLHSYRLLVSLGLGALAVTAVALVLLFRHPPSAAGPSPGVPASQPTSGPGLVCFGMVDVPHGATGLAPLQPGRVVKVLVREHEAVAAGTPLLALDDALARPRVAEARAAVTAARAQLAKGLILPAQHLARLGRQEAAVAAAEQRVAAAREALRRKEKLREQKQISAEELRVAEAQRKETEAGRDAEEKRLLELRLYNPHLDVEAARAELDRAEAKLAGEEQALAEHTLKAPQAGTVLRVLAAPGDVVGGLGRPPAVFFAPDEARIIRAEVEQEFADQVALGQAVSVEDEASGKVLGRGKVTAISGWYTQRRAPLLEPTRFNSARTLECVVALDAGHAPLRLGQRVSVRFGTGR